MSNKLNYSENTVCNQRHCLREAEHSPLQAGLNYRPQGDSISCRLGSGTPPKKLPKGHFLVPAFSPAPPTLVLRGPVRRRSGSNDTLPRNHKFMNPRSFARSGQAQSLADVREDIFLCQATERSSKTPAVRPQSPSL